MSNSDKPVQLDLHVSEELNSLYTVQVYRSASNDEFWEKLEVSHYDSNKVTVETRKGGYFVATKSVAPGPMAGKCCPAINENYLQLAQCQVFIGFSLYHSFLN